MTKHKHNHQGGEERTKEQVSHACAVLAHYHVDHTNDRVTRVTNSTGEAPDIYIISDPEAKKVVSKALSHLFPNGFEKETLPE